MVLISYEDARTIDTWSGWYNSGLFALGMEMVGPWKSA